MVIYENHGKNPLGVDLTRAYSDAGFFIERDGVMYEEAVDPTELHRQYTETDVPISEDEAKAEDYEKALADMGVAL